MGNNPLISVIVPSLNSQDYIEECISSIVKQTLEDIEVLCIDAGSTDNTVDILNKFAGEDSRIKIFNSSRKSYGFQMNIGLTNAKGKYMSIVESDDFIDENMLQELYGLAKKYDADITKTTFYHYSKYSDKTVSNIDDAKESIQVEGPFTIKDQPVFLDGHPSIWAAIYKNDFLKENNISFMEEDGAAWVDNPFFYETIFSAKKIVYRHVPYYYYRKTNPNSSSNNLTDYTIPIKRMMDNLDIVEKYEISDELILKSVYSRAFAYIYSVFRREGHEEYMHILRLEIKKMLLRLDEKIVLKHMRRKMKDTYYEYISPIHLIDNESSEIRISKTDFELMLNENQYLYSRINGLKRGKRKSDKKVKSLKNEISLIKNSKSFKLGLILAKPFRKLKSLFK